MENQRAFFSGGVSVGGNQLSNPLQQVILSAGGRRPRQPAMASGRDFMSLVRDYQKENSVTAGEAMKRIVRLFPAAHAEFLRQNVKE